MVCSSCPVSQVLGFKSCWRCMGCFYFFFLFFFFALGTLAFLPQGIGSPSKSVAQVTKLVVPLTEVPLGRWLVNQLCFCFLTTSIVLGYCHLYGSVAMFVLVAKVIQSESFVVCRHLYFSVGWQNHFNYLIDVNDLNTWYIVKLICHPFVVSIVFFSL